jgi:2-polyprenyl-3-methyl-5-hydroxy-6-metoxy-1,4-benzoquinol methylase
MNPPLTVYDDRLAKTLKLMEHCKTILDLGCYRGELTKYFINYCDHYYGIDVLSSEIEYANQHNIYPNANFEVKDFLSQPFVNRSFDCILFLETIEHVTDPFSYLKECNRLLNHDGVLIISTPNSTSLKNILYAMSYRKTGKRLKVADEISKEEKHTGTQLEHLYNWDYPTLVRLLDRAGFRIESHCYARSGIIQFKIFGRTIRLIESESRILEKLHLYPLMVHHVIKARKQ